STIDGRRRLRLPCLVSRGLTGASGSMRSVALSAAIVLGAALGVVSCGGPSPTTPAPTPLPIPAPTPTPTPTPDPEPAPNTNRPVRLNLRLYSVEDPQGNWHPPTPGDFTIP